MDDRYLPNFILIGVQRTGTTWLYTAPKSHPDVFLPYVKEVHLFDRNFDDYYENLKSDRERFIGSICRFLGIESDKITVELGRIANPTVEPRSAAVNKIAHQFVCDIRERRSKHLNQIITSV